MSYFTAYYGPNHPNTTPIKQMLQGGIYLLDQQNVTDYYIDFTYIREGMTDGNFYIVRTFFQNDDDVAQFITEWWNGVVEDPDAIGNTLIWPPTSESSSQSIPYRNYQARQRWNSETQENEWYISAYQPDWGTPSWTGFFDRSATGNAVLYVLHNTREYSMNGNVQPVGEPIEYFFTKENFKLNFGCYVNTSEAPLHMAADSDQEEQQFTKYYYTGKTKPVLRFTSQRTQTDYSVELWHLTNLAYSQSHYVIGQLGSSQSTTSYIYDIQKKNFPKGTNLNAYIEGIRALEGEYLVPQVNAQTYDVMVDGRSFNTFDLQDVVKYFQATDPTFTSDDVYTVLYLDFIDRSSLEVMATKECDFSSLYNSGIDVKDGGAGEEHYPWDPTDQITDNDKDQTKYQGVEAQTVPNSYPTVSPYGKFSRTFILNDPAVKELGELLNTTDDPKIDAIIAGLKMFGGNPIDAIVDLRLYPFRVPTITNSGNIPKEIILGRTGTGVYGIPLSIAPICSIYLGGMYIEPKFNSFLDYEPYTTMRLYIPYVGTVELLPSVYMGHIVSVNLVVDFNTGACRAVVYKDGLQMDYKDGIIGVSIPVTGDNAAAYANGIVGNLVGAIGSGFGALAKGLTGDLGGAVKEGASALGDLFDMSQSFNDVQFQQAGSASPNIGNWLPQICYITIARPQLTFQNNNDFQVYGNQIGYATAYTSWIGDLTDGGIYYGVLQDHVGDDVDEPNPTAKEIDMIKQILNNGFFVA